MVQVSACKFRKTTTTTKKTKNKNRIAEICNVKKSCRKMTRLQATPSAPPVNAVVSTNIASRSAFQRRASNSVGRFNPNNLKNKTIEVN
jgi:hypothetical protein